LGGAPTVFWFPDGEGLVVRQSDGIEIISSITVSSETTIIKYSTEEGQSLYPLTLSPRLEKILLSDSPHREDDSLYIGNLDGSGIQKLLNSTIWWTEPVWSSDGSMISVLIRDQNTLLQVGVINPDDMEFKQVTDNTDAGFLWPSISPDGQRIIIIARVNNINGNPYWNIYMVNTGGKVLYPKVDTLDFGFQTSPLICWLPDTQAVLYYFPPPEIFNNRFPPPQIFNYQTGEQIDLFSGLEFDDIRDIQISPK
jgi:hypothetical protein